MAEIKLGAIESRFADIIWDNEPLSSNQLTKLAQRELNWKMTTTYTILKRLCDRGIFQNQNSTVSSLISRDEFYALQSEKFVNDTFDGSLPAFVTAFASRNKLTEAEAAELKRLIDGMKE